MNGKDSEKRERERESERDVFRYLKNDSSVCLWRFEIAMRAARLEYSGQSVDLHTDGQRVRESARKRVNESERERDM